MKFSGSFAFGSLASCAVLAGVMLPSVVLFAQQTITGPAAFADWQDHGGRPAGAIRH
jgi:hypothetical protein